MRAGQLPRMAEANFVHPEAYTPRFEPLEPRLLLSVDVVISEFMASNSKTLCDYDGDYPDWIELRNQGTEDVALGGWHLTDDAGNLQKWHFPDVTLKANEFLVVFASDKDLVEPNGEIHTNFKLDADGEYLALVKPDGVTKVSEYAPTFPGQEKDTSYGIHEVTSDTVLLTGDASAWAWVPTDGSLESTWNVLDPSFDYTGWLYGTMGVGYEASVLLPTPTPTPMPTFMMLGSSKLYYGPYGPNGTWNLYEVVSGNKTWIQAQTEADSRTQRGMTGHLVTITSAAENAFVKGLLTTNSWIGLTDSETFGGSEKGNTSALPLPTAGQVPGPGQRGEGFVWITGEAFTYQSWYSTQPDDASPGQDAVYMSYSNGNWYDDKSGETGQTGTTRGAYVVEYEVGDRFFYGPHGPDGSWNLYQVVGSTGTWLDACTTAAAMSQRGNAGHLVTVGSEAENAFVKSLVTTASWIGLTDSATYGGSEMGDTSGLPLPTAGQAPGPGERGEGFVWVTGEPFTYQQWAGGQPNNASGGENAVEIATDGAWSDAKSGEPGQTGVTRDAYVVEYDLGDRFFYGPYGSGGAYNLYQVVSNTGTWVDAYNAAKASAQRGKTGHLVTITSAAENDFIKGLLTTTSWIGLTDSPTYGTGAAEKGDTSALPLPPDGTAPTAGQRGEGFVWVKNSTGSTEAFTYQNWADGQPDNGAGTGENAVLMVLSGAWSDAKSGEAGQTGFNCDAYVVEYDLGQKFFYGPYGPNGTWNLYELAPTTTTWINAKADAETQVYAGTPGHLVTILSAAENAFVKSLISADTWMGLTDSETFGGSEKGNTSALPLPTAGQVPGPGQRGEGFVWITGDPFTYQNWNSNQPDDATPGQDGGYLTTGGTWYDERNGEVPQTGSNKAYLIEYDLNLAGIGPCFKVQEAHSAVSLTTTTLALAALAGPATTTYSVPVINLADPQNTASGRFSGNIGFGGDTSADDNTFAIRATALVKIPTAGTYTFGVKSDDGFRLRIDGAVFTSFTLVSGTAGTVTIADDTMEHAATGASEALGVTSLSAGEHLIELVMFENTGGSGIELYAAPGARSAWDAGAFRLVGDTFNGGLAIRGVGDEVHTNLLSSLYGQNSTAYVRLPFLVEDASEVDRLTLHLEYGDGFVAYLNGVEVARANAPTTVDWDSAAAGERPYYQVTAFAEFSLSGHRDALVTGENVLAIRLLTSSPGDPSCLIVADLVASHVVSTALRYFTTPSPGAINSSGITAFVADTKFSRDRGFYDLPFDVTITCETPDAVIRYTTDGSAPTLDHGTTYTGPVWISHTTILRASAFKTDWEPSAADAQTYIFLDDVLAQTGAGFPVLWIGATGTTVTGDYAVDPNVVNDPRYAATVREDLQSIPTISIAMDVEDLFGTNGLYTNSRLDGIAWERAASIEYLDPSGGEEFQINAGLRIYGGVNRYETFPKHTFRLLFKSPYGPTKLDFPLFDDPDAVEKFDTIILRGEFNNSWPYGFSGDPLGQRQRATYTRDQWIHETQLAMGQPSSHVRYIHLYLNGLYWGLYTATERPEESFCASYLGGDKEAYDVIHDSAVTAGDKVAWNAMMAIATDTGRTADQKYTDLLQYVDMVNYIDYIILNMYGGNQDWDDHNWYAARERTPEGRFRFFCWDGERILEGVTTDITGKGTQNDKPTRLYGALLTSTEFRMLFADRLQKHLVSPGGALTPEEAAARLLALQDEIDGAIVGESARWGDFLKEPPLNRDNELATEIQRLLTQYFPQRTANLLAQFENKGLYPGLDAPQASLFGGEVPAGFSLTLTNPNATGTIWYTLDGSDPRLTGGDRAPGAVATAGPVTLNASAQVRARVFDSGTGAWSAVIDPTYYVDTPLRITELMYHPATPPPDSPYTAAGLEFIEVQNIGPGTLGLSGLTLTGGVDFAFPNETLASGERAVIVADADAFAATYGSGIRILGTYTLSLDNAGEALHLRDATGQKILDSDYKDGWYPLTDGEGFSLVVRDPLQARNLWDSAEGWRTSWQADGNPGEADPGYNPGAVVINEILAHQDTDPPGDWIELANTTDAPIAIGGWYLSDDAASPMKYRIADGTTIAAHGYATFCESSHFGNPADPGCLTPFALSELGDAVYLTAATAPGAPAGYRESEVFGASDGEVPFTRYIKSTGGKDFVAEGAKTDGQDNAPPVVGPVVISEIMYNPASGHDEYVELYNTSDAEVLLYDPAHPSNTWKFTNGIAFAFPTGSAIPAHGYALVVGIDPATFRAGHPEVPLSVAVYGPYTGLLNDAGETIELARPGDPQPDPPYTVPYYRADQVTYGISGHWPTRADGRGSSLERLSLTAYGNDAANWGPSSTGGTPGTAAVLQDATAPSVPESLTVTLVSASQIDLAWTPSTDSESGVAYYRIWRNGSNITASVAPAWSDTMVAAGTTYTYAVSAVSRDDAQSALYPTPVTVRLVVVTQASNPDLATVRLVFNENVQRDSAQDAANYAVTWSGGSIAVTEAVLQPDQKTVLLTLASPLTVGTAYAATTNNVLATSLFAVMPDCQAAFTCAAPPAGSVVREYWTGITGNTVLTLTGNSKFPDSPSGVDELYVFDAPTNWTDNYGTRVRGYVTAPATGDYTFWIAADDTAELWLSSDEDPANAVKIAWTTSATGHNEWKTAAPQKSALIALQAGQRYYIEALHKEASGSDHLSVGWQLPDGTYERPIPAERLTPFTPDVTVGVTATDADAFETGPDKGTFCITRTGNTGKRVTLYYSVAGTAHTADVGETLTGSVTLDPGVTSRTIDITPADDAENESEETVTLTLIRSPAYAIDAGAASATILIADNEFPRVTGIEVNGHTDRSASAVDPGGRGIRTIIVAFSEPVTFDDGDIVLQAVTFADGVETPGAALEPGNIAGLGTDTLTITLPYGAALDTWVKVTLAGGGTLADFQNHRLDGDPAPAGGHTYIYDAVTDLPTGNGLAGGDAVFYLASLRGDFNGDGHLTAADLPGFQAAWAAKDLDADFRGAGFGVRPPDGRVTLGDVDGFASVYQAALATGRSLGSLPVPTGSMGSLGSLGSSMGGTAAGSATSATSDVLLAAAGSATSATSDVLLGAAGWVQAAASADWAFPLAAWSAASASDTDPLADDAVYAGSTNAAEPDVLGVTPILRVSDGIAACEAVMRF